MILIDSNIPMYLVGTPHRHKADAQILLETRIKERRRAGPKNDDGPRDLSRNLSLPHLAAGARLRPCDCDHLGPGAARGVARDLGLRAVPTPAGPRAHTRERAFVSLTRPATRMQPEPDQSSTTPSTAHSSRAVRRGLRFTSWSFPGVGPRMHPTFLPFGPVAGKREAAAVP